MLGTLILENFKAFGKRQVIPLAPITLIFGANSAGKSSILQSLLLLKQTLSQAESNETLLLPKGDLVDLGSFREMVFGHDTTRLCEVTPLLAPEELAQRRVFGYTGAYNSTPRASAGVGFRFGFDEVDRVIQLNQLRCYWENARTPAYALTPADIPRGRERVVPRSRYVPRPGFESYTRFVKVSELDDEHALWNELYGEFTNQRLHHYVERLKSTRDNLLETQSEPTAAQILYQSRLLADQADPGRSIDDQKAQRWLKTVVEQLSKRLNRMAHYNLGLFLEDIKKENSQRSIALRNFLPDEATVLARRPDDVEFLLGRLEDDLVTRRAEQPVPDLVRLSLSFAWELRRLFDNLVYLGPLREYPERHYIFSGNVAREVGKSGRLLPDLLYRRQELVEQTNDMLKAFDIGYTLRVHRVEDPAVEDVFGLRLVDDRSGTTVSMLDVGFGISQVLPVIVQSMLSQRNVILIEQPEIHLHPRLQADLGTLFAKGIATPRRNQFIIETHSEHLILRLQRLIRKGELKATDVSVLYVMKGDEGSRCYPLRIDEEGDFIDEWPEGFFEEGYREVFG